MSFTVFLIFFSLPLGGTGWLEWTGLGYFPSPGQALVNKIPLKVGLVKSRVLWPSSAWFLSLSLSEI